MRILKALAVAALALLAPTSTPLAMLPGHVPVLVNDLPDISVVYEDYRNTGTNQSITTFSNTDLGASTHWTKKLIVGVMRVYQKNASGGLDEVRVDDRVCNYLGQSGGILIDNSDYRVRISMWGCDDAAELGAQGTVRIDHASTSIETSAVVWSVVGGEPYSIASASDSSSGNPSSASTSATTAEGGRIVAFGAVAYSSNGDLTGMGLTFFHNRATPITNIGGDSDADVRLIWTSSYVTSGANYSFGIDGPSGSRGTVVAVTAAPLGTIE